MKPVIIIAKGPSARFLDSSDKYDVATVNNAIWMHRTPKWSFFNDLEPMEQMVDEDFEGVTTMIVPSFLHTTGNIRFDRQSGHFHFHRLAEFFPGRYDHVDFHVYELHPGDNTSVEERERTGLENSNVPKLDEWPRSTAQSATMWLVKYEGVKDIIAMGCDPSGGYHPYFDKRSFKNEDGSPAFEGASTHAWDADGYRQDFEQSKKWANHYGASFRHVNDVGEEERKELGI